MHDTKKPAGVLLTVGKYMCNCSDCRRVFCDDNKHAIVCPECRRAPYAPQSN